MENATDALKMAGAVMLFVMALSIIILSFGQVGEASDTILNYRDRETSYLDVTYNERVFTRTVNLETIIPSIYRAFLENYIIVFEGLNYPIYYMQQNTTSTPTEKYTIDLRTQNTGNENTSANNATLATDDEAKIQFISAILYHNHDPAIFNSKFHGITFGGPETSLYNQLRNAGTIVESLGIYDAQDNPNIPEVMREEKRIITYTLQ